MKDKLQNILHDLMYWIKNNVSTVTMIMMFGLVGVLLTVAHFLPAEGPASAEMPYTQFKTDMENKKVDTILYGNDAYMTVTLSDGTTYTTDYPAYADFRKEMLENGITLKIKEEKYHVDIISVLGMIGSGAFLLFFGYLMYRMVKEMVGTTGFTERELVQTSNVKFDDIIGLDEIKDDVQYAVHMIQHPEDGQTFGVSPCKGILFDGDPGCGKTLIAKAIAGEAGVPFISVSGSSFINKYVGVGASHVRKVFELARKKAPCVVFIDEIDAVAGQRGKSSCGEYDQTVNALLTEMDGFGGRDGVLVIAATNRADMLDEAVVRPGRFDRKITIRKPKDWKIRRDMFNHYLSGKPLAEDVDIECISKQTADYSGADIRNACNEAGSIAMQRGLKYITMDCLEEAVDKKVFSGNRVKNSEERSHDKEIVAYHEAGHAVVTYLLGLPIARASIIGTTSGVGGAVFREDTDSQFMTKQSIEDFVKIAYGGRASEEIKYGANNITTGASNDITQATNMLANAVSRYGFYSQYGLLDANMLQRAGLGNEKESLKLIKDKSAELYQMTVDLLSANYDKVTDLAEALLKQETMTGDQVKEVLENKKAA